MFGLAACGQPGPAPAPMRSPSQSAAVDPELSPALAPLAWWLGDWAASDGPGSEHWIWHRQPDGSWKVLFDTGRIVQAP
jgi:hypothetical protein